MHIIDHLYCTTAFFERHCKLLKLIIEIKKKFYPNLVILFVGSKTFSTKLNFDNVVSNLKCPNNSTNNTNLHSTYGFILFIIIGDVFNVPPFSYPLRSSYFSDGQIVNLNEININQKFEVYQENFSRLEARISSVETQNINLEARNQELTVQV